VAQWSCCRFVAFSSSTLKALEQNYIVIQEQEVLRTDNGPLSAGNQPKSPAGADLGRWRQLQLDAYGSRVVAWVTGSGKTGVYLQAIAPTHLQESLPSSWYRLVSPNNRPFPCPLLNEVCVYHNACLMANAMTLGNAHWGSRR